MKTREGKSVRNAVIFSIVALSCGWMGRLVDVQAGRDENGSLGQLIWLVSPLLCMIILRAWAGDGWRDFGLKPRLKGNGLAYLFSMLFFPLLATVIVGIGLGSGWTEAPSSSSSYLAAFGIALLPSLVKNVFEEFAWRGYLAPRLFSLGYNRFLVHIVVGIIWGAWHFPYLFLFVDTAESMLTYMPRMMLGVIAMSILYGELLLLTRSVWPAVLMHTMGNAFIDTLILKRFILVDEAFAYVAMPSPEGMLAIALTGLCGIWMYRRRRGKPVIDGADPSVRSSA
ncbi:CPBP family glutamic-type intramembrane protease [Paenibacillus xanthanilyticus]|uniref:Type II CAAX prenyl endopeptidase Rce1 family protein n=1 Tax=Paenibacillus xanthanilyticus TaxID=1783531 RepID=A0ABV8JVM5_9BACL